MTQLILTMSNHLQLPVDTAWLRDHAPPGTEFESTGFCRIPFKPRGGWGHWSLTVWWMRNGRRQIDLKAMAVGDPVKEIPEGSRSVACELATVRTRAQLINLFNRFSQEAWTT